ncbi:hypothetical protein QM797_26185, partial [Rhodococcus sp. IEGM 1381]|uniref:hypothetical protein n=1 Tax=Rhodococcus sp. IEGM 1381 TaxID=3047085 RepID=UPI0024B78C60
MQNRAAAEVSDPKRRWCRLSLAVAAAAPVPGAGPWADVEPDVAESDGGVEELDSEEFGAISGAGDVCSAG